LIGIFFLYLTVFYFTQELKGHHPDEAFSLDGSILSNILSNVIFNAQSLPLAEILHTTPKMDFN